MTEDEELLDCLLNLTDIVPDIDIANQNCLNFEWLELNQEHGAHIQEWVQKYHQTFISRPLSDKVDLITHVKPGDDPNMDWKSVLPENISTHVIRWFHQVLIHPYNTRVRDAIHARYYHPYVKHVKYINDLALSFCQKGT